MTILYAEIPLFDSSNYSFNAPLDGTSYEIWLYYNERMEQWIFNLLDIEGNPIVMGQGVVVQYPIFLDYNIQDLRGYFWFEPIGKDQNETITNPFELKKYYNLYYIYDDGEENV